MRQRRFLTPRGQGSRSEAALRQRTMSWGLIGTIVAVIVLLAALSVTTLQSLFDGPTYSAAFTEAGGLVGGDDVVVSGVIVGKVRSVDLVGDHVQVDFNLTEAVAGLGTSTGAAVVSETALGKKALEIIPAGPGRLDPATDIPTSRTTPSFDVTQALASLTQNIASINTSDLAQSLTEVSKVLNAAAPDVRPALDGLSRLSETISSRDAALSQLLASSAGVTHVLSARDSQVQALFIDGSSLLASLNSQRQALSQIFEDTDSLAIQLNGLVQDNRSQIGPALHQINALMALLQRNKANINAALDAAGPLVRELGEVVSAIPGFNVYVPNLPPTNLVPGLPLGAGGKG